MNVSRRGFLQVAVGAASFPTLSSNAQSLAYPTRPVHLIVGTVPGGAQDIVARLVAQWLTERLGQPVVVENRPGGAGNIGTESVVRASPDGYTLLVISANNAINTSLFTNLKFDFARDITPVAGISRNPLVMEVNPSLPARTVSEFIAYAKANPGKINFASAGIGSTPHLAGELFNLMAGTNMLHVPYRGGAPAVAALLGGQVQVMFGNIDSSIEHIKAGRLPVLAVTTTTRSAALPDVPTVAESLPGYEASGWQGVGAPRNTPTEIVARLNTAINDVLADPKLKERLAKLGGTVVKGPPPEFANLVSEEIERWAKVVKVSGATLN